MNPKNQSHWDAITSLCADGTVTSINVAGNQRRAAVLAKDAECEALRDEARELQRENGHLHDEITGLEDSIVEIGHAIVAMKAKCDAALEENAAFRALFDRTNAEATAALKVNILRGLEPGQVAALVRSLKSDEQKGILDAAAAQGESDANKR